MKLLFVIKLSWQGLSTIVFRRKKPLIASIIITDKCNLSCRHCAVGNITGLIYPHLQIQAEMQKLFSQGIRILLLYGGEPFLWEDNGITLRDLVIEAKQMGFLVVSVVTNGTLGLDLPEADLLLVSIDGSRGRHNEIRGDTYDKIIENIKASSNDKICLYMAVNQINKDDIEEVCKTAESTRNICAVSFNFHTPYPGTEDLKLSRDDKRECCSRIEKMMELGYPVLNVRSAFPYIADNTFPTPCRQCVIMENNQQWTCGRCIDIEGLCDECGYFFAAEFSLLFGGNIKVIWDMLRTYGRYI